MLTKYLFYNYIKKSRELLTRVFYQEKEKYEGVSFYRFTLAKPQVNLSAVIQEYTLDSKH